jgi:hypothetical protein
VPIYVAFRENEHVGTREFQGDAAQWLAYALPYRRFAVTLAGASARLGADADRYSFTVVDVHHLLLAGLCRRTVFLDFCSLVAQPDGMVVNRGLTENVNVWLTVDLTLAGERPCQKGKLSKLKSASIAVPFAERRKRR